MASTQHSATQPAGGDVDPENGYEEARSSSLSASSSLVLDILGSGVLDDLRDTLSREGHPNAADMLDEALAAVVIVALDKPSRRGAALALLLPTTRHDLEARGIIDRVTEPRVHWVLTPYGAKVVACVAAAVPSIDSADDEPAVDILGEIDEIVADE